MGEGYALYRSCMITREVVELNWPDGWECLCDSNNFCCPQASLVD